MYDVPPEHPPETEVIPERPGRRRFILVAALAVAALVLTGMQHRTLVMGVGDLGTSVRQGLRQRLEDAVNTLRGPVTVGLQVGHYRAAEHPDELARLRTSTGGSGHGLLEVDLNRAVAEAMQQRLEAHGVQVELLSATVPPNYRADLVVALHADASLDPRRRGYKSAHFDPPRSSLEPLLKSYLDRAYETHMGLPNDHHNITPNMSRYYAFNQRRFRHSVARSTPGVIVEMGYLTNLDDLLALKDAERPAEALVQGVLEYLRDRGRLPEETTESTG